MGCEADSRLASLLHGTGASCITSRKGGAAVLAAALPAPPRAVEARAVQQLGRQFGCGILLACPGRVPAAAGWGWRAGGLAGWSICCSRGGLAKVLSRHSIAFPTQKVSSPCCPVVVTLERCLCIVLAFWCLSGAVPRLIGSWLDWQPWHHTLAAFVCCLLGRQAGRLVPFGGGWCVPVRRYGLHIACRLGRATTTVANILGTQFLPLGKPIHPHR